MSEPLSNEQLSWLEEVEADKARAKKVDDLWKQHEHHAAELKRIKQELEECLK